MINNEANPQDNLKNALAVSQKWGRHLISRQEVGVLILLVLMISFLVYRTDTFTTPQNIRSVTLSFSWIAIAAFGQTLVIITAGLDLSSGSVMALSGLAAAYFISGEQSPWAVEQVTESGRTIVTVSDAYIPLAIVSGCAMGLLLGLFNGVLVAWGGLPPFIATLGMMSLARGVCYGWAQGRPFRQLAPGFKEIGQGEVAMLGYEIPYPTLIMLGVALVLSIFLMRTIWGYRIYALGGNEQAAQLSGINTRHVKLLVYAIAGLTAGLGGTLMTARLNVAAPDAARGYELDVIVAVFIGGASVSGGKGTIFGTLIGAAIMQVLRNGLNLLGIDAYWQPAAIGAVIILAIMFDRARQTALMQSYWRQHFKRASIEDAPVESGLD